MIRYLWLVEVSDDREVWETADVHYSRADARFSASVLIQEGFWKYARVVKFVSVE